MFFWRGVARHHSRWEKNSRRPLTMFSDHDNPVTAAAAAPAHEAHSDATPEANPIEMSAAHDPSQTSSHDSSGPSHGSSHETPSQRTEEDPKVETSTETPAA